MVLPTAELDRLVHEIAHPEMTMELQRQLEDLSGIHLTAITVTEISTGGNSASYGVELRLTDGADLGNILQKMQSLGWKYQGQDRNIPTLHSFIITTLHPAANNWRI